MKTKYLGLVLGLVAAAGTVKAEETVPETLYWKGSEGGLLESSSWTNAAGTVKVPGWRSTLVIPVGGSFSNLNEKAFGPKILRITTSDPVTIEGAGFHFEEAGTFQVTNGATVTVTGTINLGWGNTTAQHVLDVAAGSTLYLNGTLTGPNGLKFANLGTVYLNGANDYWGKTTFQLGQIHACNDQAFGTCTNGATDGAFLNLNSETVVDQLRLFFDGSHTYGEYFELNTHKKVGGSVGYPMVFAAGTTTTFTGTIYHTGAPMNKMNAGAKVVYAGQTRYSNPSFAFASPAEIVFAGEGTSLWDDYMNGTGHVRVQKPIQMHSAVQNPQTRAYWLRVYEGTSTTPSRILECENAIYVNGVLGYVQWQANGTMDIRGYDQTFWTLDCGSNFKKGTLYSEQTATVHLNLTDSWNATASDFYGRINGQINLSLEGAKPIRFYGQSDTTGTLALTNGANLSFMTGSTWAGKKIRVSGGANLTLNDAGTLPEDVEIEIVDDPDGTKPKSKIVLNANLKIGKLTINGESMAQNSTIGNADAGGVHADNDHFGGQSLIIVGSGSLGPTAATWTGLGNDDLVSTTNNWSTAPDMPNMRGGIVTASFAAGGTQALFPYNGHAKGLVFTNCTFTLAPAATCPAATLTVGEGHIAVKTNELSDATEHVVTIDMPLVINDDSFEARVEGAKNTLRLTRNITSASTPTIPFTFRGGGTLYTDGTNAVPGTREQYDGVWYAPASALGPSNTTVNIRNAVNNSRVGSVAFYLNGGRYEQNFSLVQAGAYFTFGAVANTTNDLVLPFSFNNSHSIAHIFYANSRTRFLKGYKKDGSWVGLISCYANSEIVFTGGPFLYNESSLPARFACWESSAEKRARLEFGYAGGHARKGLAVGGAFDAHFTADAAFCTNTYASPLYLQFYSYTTNHPKLHLHGTRQYFGDYRTDVPRGLDTKNDTTGAVIDGPAGSELHLFQNTTNETLHAVFTDHAALVKSGAATLTLAGASTTAGRLEVTAGTVAFSGEGCWTNGAQVVVSGGTLKVDANTRMAKNSAFALSGDGKLELADGVKVRGTALELPDGKGGTVQYVHGTFNSANCPFITGGGRLVLKTGCAIILR